MLSKFYCLYFPLALIRWKSSHCHLRELFKSKENWKKKFDSNNNCKTAWSRMIVKWHLVLILSLGFVWKMLSFVGKHLSFYPKRYLFIFCIFYLNEKELNQEVYLIKFVENQISNSTSHTQTHTHTPTHPHTHTHTHTHKERSKNIIQLQKYF